MVTAKQLLNNAICSIMNCVCTIPILSTYTFKKWFTTVYEHTTFHQLSTVSHTLAFDASNNYRNADIDNSMCINIVYIGTLCKLQLNSYTTVYVSVFINNILNQAVFVLHYNKKLTHLNSDDVYDVTNIYNFLKKFDIDSGMISKFLLQVYNRADKLI